MYVPKTGEANFTTQNTRHEFQEKLRKPIRQRNLLPHLEAHNTAKSSTFVSDVLRLLTYSLAKYLYSPVKFGLEDST